VAAINPEFCFFFLLNGTTQLKTIRFFKSKKKLAEIHIENQLLQLPSAVKTTSILDVKLVQAFARVSMARDPITSLSFWIRSFNLLRDFAMALNSETPHKKYSKGLQ
jgi:hypothetical protein